MALTKVTGQVIKNTTDVTVGVLTVTNTLAVGGTVSIGGTLTYEDVTNVDAVGLITARNGIVVGSGITLSKDGDIFATGVTTATTFVGAVTGNVTGNISGGTVAGSTGTFSGAVSGTTGTFSGAVSGTTGTFTGNVSIADKIIHTGDTDTAIRFAGDDVFTIETGGSERVRVDSVGLKILDKLAHFGDIDTAIRFPEVDKVTVETSGSERLAIEPSGNVFIHQNAAVGSGLTVGGLGAGTSLSTVVGQGFIELTRSSGDTYIDFKDSFAGDDFDCRIITSSANQLQFFTGGQSTALCALQTGTGQVGIATNTAPSIAKLEIHSDKLGGTAGNTQELLYMLSPDITNTTSYRFTNYRHTNGTTHTSSEGRLRRHVDVTDQGFIGFGDGYVNIGYGTAEKIRFPSSGGIDFSATSGSAAGATSEILDDYEEGTFTPTCQSGGFGNWTTNSGRYTKIGRLVNVSWENGFNGSGDGSTLIIGGLPFTADDWTPGTMYAGDYTDESSQMATPAVVASTTTIKVITWGAEATGNKFGTNTYSAWNITYTTSS